MMQLLNQSRAVRTKVLPEVRAAIADIDIDLDSVSNYETAIVEWLKPVIDLSQFNVYPMNGITEGLNWWTGWDTRGIEVAEGDYQWISSTGRDIRYISIPSAIDGNFKDVPTDVPVALDLAYVGSTEIRPITVSDNIELAFYSLSKPFGIRNVRTGWYFTRSKDARLEELTRSAKYFNYTALAIAERIIKTFKIDYVYQQLRTTQLSICSQYQFTPSDSVWLATSDDPMYSKFRRGHTNRLCLSDLISANL